MRANQKIEITDKESGKAYTLRRFIADQKKELARDYIEKKELLKTGIISKDELAEYEKIGKIVPLIKSKNRILYKRSDIKDYFEYIKQNKRWGN